MTNGLYDNISKNCKNIISNNNPKNSINIISNMVIPGSNVKIGKDSASQIYKTYADNSVEYNNNKYKNNINKYKTKVDSNINKASISI